MARTVSLAQLLDAVRQRTDTQNSEHVTDPEITEYIQESVAALHAIVVDTAEDDYTEEATFSTVVGQAEYSLPTDVGIPSFYKLRSIHIEKDGVYSPLRRWTLEAWSALQNTVYSGGTLWAPPTFYRVLGAGTIPGAFAGSRLTLYPTPQDVRAVKVFYVPASQNIESEGSYDGRDGWEEWIVLDASIKVAIKEESDTTELVREREKVEQRIRRHAAAVDQAHPDRVQDVDRWW